MSMSQKTQVIAIHSKIDPQQLQSEQISDNHRENGLQSKNNIHSGLNVENEPMMNVTNHNQTINVEEDHLKNHKDINNINIKDRRSISDDEEEKLEQTILQKPGSIDKGYILYSDSLMEKLISDKRLSNPLLKQFKVDREPIWTFVNEGVKSVKDLEDIRVLCITWNMHGNMPQLCTKRLLRTDEIQHHVIVVSTQECQRSIPMSFFCENKAKWEAHLAYELGNQYILIKSVSMNALHLGVFLHQSIVKYATAISTDCKATGIGNLIGNKGGVGISMDIGEKSFLFINSHFSSGQKNNPRRNQDYQKISSSLNLPKYYSNQNESLFKRFNYIFWMGDFNYRIEAKTKQEVDQLLTESKFFELLKKDQLMAQKKIGQVFSDFSEGLILFPPSYKMLDEENKYSEGSDARIPGWTDRILFKQKNPNSISLLNYEMALDVFGSDHRPVFAQFLVKAKFNENFQPISIKESSTACNIF